MKSSFHLPSLLQSKHVPEFHPRTLSGFKRNLAHVFALDTGDSIVFCQASINEM